ncbi:MAG: TIGR00730 family Rossman fold protein [Acidiferrobacterales bacterium]|nr:TIGR00730 family Rossman fold protein [Acidiferrobacterales bacterium]
MSQNRLNFPDKDLRHSSMRVTNTGTTQEEIGKIFQVMSEFAEGFDQLSGIHPAVSFFGSARTKRSHKHYRFARSTAKLLSASGFSIISGGGPGIMEAVNRGAQDGGSPSIGLNIVLPGRSETPNEYQDVSIAFHNFFVRKLMFVQYASAYVVMPGGLGTLDEVIECLVLMQTDKARRIPVILAGRSYWKGLVDWLEDTLLAEKTISKSDFDLFQILDEPEDIRDAIMDHYELHGFNPLLKRQHIQI